MNDSGFDPAFSCAITAASATIDRSFHQAFPGYLRDAIRTSVGALFLGGMIPGILLAVALMVYIFFISHKRKYPRGEKIALRAFIVFTIQAIPALLTPVILLMGIYSGVMTPHRGWCDRRSVCLVIAVFAYKLSVSRTSCESAGYDTESARPAS